MVGEWTEFKDIMAQNDPDGLIKPLKIREEEGGNTYWTSGPYRQFGITAVLCEGAGNFYTKKQNLDSGIVLMKSIVEYYKGTR